MVGCGKALKMRRRRKSLFEHGRQGLGEQPLHDDGALEGGTLYPCHPMPRAFPLLGTSPAGGTHYSPPCNAPGHGAPRRRREQLQSNQHTPSVPYGHRGDTVPSTRLSDVGFKSLEQGPFPYRIHRNDDSGNDDGNNNKNNTTTTTTTTITTHTATLYPTILTFITAAVLRPTAINLDSQRLEPENKTENMPISTESFIDYTSSSVSR